MKSILFAEGFFILFNCGIVLGFVRRFVGLLAIGVVILFNFLMRKVIANFFVPKKD